MVPHLTTALNGPLLELEQRILDASTAIEKICPKAKNLLLAAAALELKRTAPTG